MSYFVDISLLKRNPRFCLLFSGQAISFLGTAITSVALPYQIYHITHSTLMIGLLSLFQLLPLLVTALLGGVFADRHHRRALLIIAEILLALACLLLALNAYLAEPHIGLIFLIAPIMSAITGLHRPAMDGLTQQLVERQDFAAVSSLVGFVYSGGMIIGPAIGGLLIAHFGLVTAYVVDFASFFISLIAIINIKNVPHPAVTHDLSTWASLKQGFKYAMSRQELVGTYAVDFVAMIFGMPNALFPAIAQSLGGVKTLGLLYSAPAVGSLVISVYSGWVHHIKKHGIAIAIAAVLWGLSIILFGLSKELWLALVFLAFAGAADAVSGIFRQMIWNHTIPTEFRGRLSGIAMISYLSGPKLGDTESGLVAAAFGVGASVISGGVLCIIGVGICCWALPKFTKYQAE
ncbi:MAG: entS [Gammaproteobacteria bacterium]|jgi:MFS family permease|nr:entS [Gammaproteobacteria bacterium]